MGNLRKKAEDIFAKMVASDHVYTIDMLAKALLEARNEGLEEAATVADTCSGSVKELVTSDINKDLIGYTAKTISDAIRQLKELSDG